MWQDDGFASVHCRCAHVIQESTRLCKWLRVLLTQSICWRATSPTRYTPAVDHSLSSSSRRELSGLLTVSLPFFVGVFVGGAADAGDIFDKGNLLPAHSMTILSSAGSGTIAAVTDTTDTTPERDQNVNDSRAGQEPQPEAKEAYRVSVVTATAASCATSGSSTDGSSSSSSGEAAASEPTSLCPVVALTTFAAQLSFKAALHLAVFSGEHDVGHGIFCFLSIMASWQQRGVH